MFVNTTQTTETEMERLSFHVIQGRSRRRIRRLMVMKLVTALRELPKREPDSIRLRFFPRYARFKGNVITFPKNTFTVNPAHVGSMGNYLFKCLDLVIPNNSQSKIVDFIPF